MDAHFLTQNVKTDLHDSFKLVLELLKKTNLDQNDIATKTLLEQLEKTHKPNTNPLEELAETFTFITPTYDFDFMLRRLEGTPLQANIHFREHHGITYMNLNVNCYRMVDPEIRAEEAKRALLLRHPQSTNEEITDAQDVARTTALRFNHDALAETPNWTILQRNGGNDVRQEDSLLQFLDSSHKQLHWYNVIRNLKKHGETYGYTMDHYKRCLDRFVGYFNPNLISITDTLEAVPLAKFLLRHTMPESTKDRLNNQLRTLTRQPNSPLRYTMNELHAIATAFYTDQEPSQATALINRFMIMGLYHFTTGTTKQTLSSSIDYAQTYNKTLDWKTLLESATYSERLHGLPQQPLLFNPQANTNISLFHSSFLPVELPDFSNPIPVDNPIQFGNPPHQTYTPPPPYTNFAPPALTPIKNPVQLPPATIQPVQIKPQPASPVKQPKQERSSRSPHRDARRSLSPAPSSLRRSERTKNAPPRFRSYNTTVSRSPSNSRPQNNSRSPTPAQNRPDSPYRNNSANRNRSQSPYRNNDRSHRDQNRSHRDSRSYDRSHRDQGRSHRDATSPAPRMSNNQQQPYNSKQPSNSSQTNNYYNNRSSRPASRSPNYSRPYQSPSRYQSNNRPQSPRYNYSSNKSPNRSQNYNRSNSYNRDNSRNRSNYQPNRSYSNRSPSPYNRSTHPNRSSSSEQFPGFLPGVNCSSDYLPWTSKNCKKCSTYADHHECYCPTYYRFNRNKCSICQQGYHMPSECKRSRSSQSPSRLRTNHSSLN